MILTAGPTEVSVDPALPQEVESVLEGLRPSAPADLTGARSRYTDLAVDEPELRDRLIAVAAGLPGTPDPATVRVHRHGVGDFTLPRRAGDSAAGNWTLTFPLTDSEVDGVTAWTGERFERLPDRVGAGLVLEPGAWTWVSPVRGAPRYSVVMGVR
ncbi:hypothetical protein IDM40_20525 [Nocardiopsis sp. HNM0947]|uniref:Uncharacterized protein n=1 Tax=Nocardiopsis coralli TaxID=2772213 RepID=A0ABR9PB44_9ACTN|nr:hypothetical protein [Nocardiopsis coralli]MBE3001058.1 hypothetical protein [Nocardiopsis coralli]